MTLEREDWTFMSYHACERGFRENMTFSSEIQLESTGLSHIGSTMINMIGKQHKSYRSVAQPVFIRPRVLDWWKRRWDFAARLSPSPMIPNWTPLR